MKTELNPSTPKCSVWFSVLCLLTGFLKEISKSSIKFGGNLRFTDHRGTHYSLLLINTFSISAF